MVKVHIICAFSDSEIKEKDKIFEAFANTVSILPFAPRVGMKIDLEGFRPEDFDENCEIDLPTCEIKEIVFFNSELADIWVDSPEFK